MKYVMILPDGAADEPVAELGGKTPLEAAHKPGIDWIAKHGQQGCVRTVPNGFSPGSDVATLSLFGYDPRVCYTGRAPLEAAAKGIPVGPHQLVFRCNFVTLADGRMEDFTAGHISQGEADRLVGELNDRLGHLPCRFHSGVSYRNLMVTEPGLKLTPQCTPPHDIPGQPIESYLPKGEGGDWCRMVMDRAREVLAGHELNLVRRDLGENPATDIWLWGQGRPAELVPFVDRFGVPGVVIAAVDLIRGIAKCAGMELIDVPGATGYLDTDYAAKGRAASTALEWFDLVIVHIEAPDEAGHQGDVSAKVTAIERIDEFVVRPLLDRLKSFANWKIMVVPDHPTPVSRRVHSATPPPFCLAGHMVPGVLGQPFSESIAARGNLHIERGHELIEYFLKR